MYVIILLFLLSFSSAKNSCPDVTPVENFELNAYASGKWYEIGRYENKLENGTCVVMNSTQEGIGYRLQVSEVDDNTLRVYDGILLNIEPGRGVLEYIFEGYEVVMNVITTNYSNYAVEYNCWYNETSDEITEQGWIMSRTNELNDDIKKEIMELLQDANFTSTDKIIWDDFSKESCGYDSEDIDTTLPEDLQQILDD